MIRVTDTIVLEERNVKERFARASGPGGQNVNKDPTAVALRVDVGCR
jgi:ribosome-associated protein